MREVGGRQSDCVGRQYPQHFLNFLPLPHGQGSFRPTLGLRTLTGGDVPRIMAATLDSSLRGNPSPPKSIFVFCRKTVPAELTFSEVSIAATLRWACRRNSLASSARPCSSHASASRSMISERFGNGKPLAQELLAPAPIPQFRAGESVTIRPTDPSPSPAWIHFQPLAIESLRLAGLTQFVVRLR